MELSKLNKDTTTTKIKKYQTNFYVVFSAQINSKCQNFSVIMEKNVTLPVNTTNDAKLCQIICCLWTLLYIMMGVLNLQDM